MYPSDILLFYLKTGREYGCQAKPSGVQTLDSDGGWKMSVCFRYGDVEVLFYIAERTLSVYPDYYSMYRQSFYPADGLAKIPDFCILGVLKKRITWTCVV
jgi:hypothetical protein